MEDLNTFLVRRLGELTALEAEVQARIEAIQAEKNQLYRAAEAAGLSLNSFENKLENKENNNLDDEFSYQKSKQKRIKGVTMKEATLIVMREFGSPLLAADILNSIKKKYNVDFERSSLSPQLSRLKSEGKIELLGQHWSLTEKGLVTAGNLSFTKSQ